ncbi:Prkg1 [Symbiodinium sp. CCMP2456]|nr:Prkg1 [Symbiodinium sp. CCMP2456]
MGTARGEGCGPAGPAEIWTSELKRGPERLIKALSRPLPAERLPVKPGGIKHLQEHEWFEGFDWNALQAGEMPPPHVPDVADDEDLSNFLADPKDLPEPMPYLDPEDGWEEGFATVE